MNTGLLDMFHDAGDEHVLAVAQAVHIDLDGIGQIAVDQQGPLVGNDEFGMPGQGRGQALQVAIEFAAVGDDLHAAPAQHV